MRHGGQVDILQQRREQRARLGALHSDDGPLFGDRRQPDAQVGEFGLPIVLHVVQHGRGAARGGGDVEAVGCEPGDDAVVQHEAVLAQHKGIAAASDGQTGDIDRINQIEECRGIRANDFDLAERGGVEQTHGTAHGTAFARDGGGLRFAGARKAAGTLPGADVLEDRTLRRGPVVQRRVPHRLQQFAARGAGQRAECHRRIGHAERRVPDSGDRLLQQAGDSGQGVDVRRLALVGCHARGGVALDMLDRAKAFARGNPQVLGGDVVLQIDEGLGRTRHPLPPSLVSFAAQAH